MEERETKTKQQNPLTQQQTNHRLRHDPFDADNQFIFQAAIT